VININKSYCVYIHTNKSNNKYYVGITCQKPKNRWRNGNGYEIKTYFAKAIKKYGWDNFDHEIIASNLTEQEAKNFEIILIQKLNSNNPKYGYNLTKGGDGLSGFMISEKSKIKMSDAKKGLYIGKNNPMYGVSPQERMDELTYNEWIRKHKNNEFGSSNPNSKKNNLFNNWRNI
jgi:group I intron endonuclease